MKNREYYVVSPNVWKDNNQAYFEKLMYEKQIVLMGWSSTEGGGIVFNKIRQGDIIIVAQGANRQKKLFFAGEVVSDSFVYNSEVGKISQCRKLTNFINIHNFDIGFSTDCTYGNSNQITAIHKLKPDNPADLKIITNIDMLLTMEQNKLAMETIINILESKKNIILQGAPGTGKTYSTAALALSIIGESYDPANHKDIMEKYQQLVDAKRIFFTTFHQSMDYEDFVEGLRPEVVDNNVSYSVKDGIFKIACGYAEEKDSMMDIDNAIEDLKDKCSIETLVLKTTTGVDFFISYRGGTTFRVRSSKSQAEEGRDFPVNINNIKEYHKNDAIKAYNKSYVRGIYQYLTNTFNIKPYDDKTVKEKQQNYVLIIDEINRGNISKILGELITLLENDKRQGGTHPIKAVLPYSNEPFTVPSNLYIIGTMNTTDRSVGHIDYAVRRRFAFYTLKADENTLKSYYVYNSIANGTKEIAEDLFDKINTFISTEKSPELDAEDLMVGHSYFMAESIDKLKMKLEYEIIPLLREYEKDGILSISIEDLRKQEVEWKNLFINKA